MPRYLKSTQFITFDVADYVARITLNRPEKRNSLNEGMLRELHAALLEADARRDVHAILLSGAGKDFCAGYDLTDIYAEGGDEDAELYRSRNATLDDDAWGIEQTQRYISIIADLHKPVIAKVQGNCLAGGTDIALYCDMVIAADEAKIGFPAVRANGTPPNNMWFYHVGPQWAKRLLMTGDIIRGREAARIGLVLESVPAQDLDEAADKLVYRVSRIDAELLSAQKRVVNMAMELAGARTLQRFAAETDARAHLASGPRRTRFRSDMKELGLNEAVRNRDEPFGDSIITLRDPGLRAGPMTEPADDMIEVGREGAVAILTLDNPARLNALNLAMRRALFDNLVRLHADESCRAIVLTGAQGNFTAGGDISEMEPRAIVEGRMRVELMTRVFRMLVTGPKPVICAVEGKAFGAGVSFAAASDYAVAASDAQFSCAFIKVGLIPDGGAIWSLARKLGPRKAMELCAFAEPFDAAAALEMQLVNRVCEPGGALDAAMGAAEKFARNPPVAMALLKAALNGGNEGLEQAIATEIASVSTLMNTQDFAEATQAFREKRPPVFTGR